MVVLESIAKEIDPSIQILKCAIPYFKFIDNPIKEINHEKLSLSMVWWLFVHIFYSISHSILKDRGSKDYATYVRPISLYMHVFNIGIYWW